MYHMNHNTTCSVYESVLHGRVLHLSIMENMHDSH